MNVPDTGTMFYIASATAQINYYPRERLGSFASNEELLITLLARHAFVMAHADYDYLVASSDNKISFDDSYVNEIAVSHTKFHDAYNKYLYQLDDGIDIISNGVNELLMWEHRDERSVLDIKYSNSQDAEVFSDAFRIRVFNMIVDHPEYSPYCEVGITDSDFIESCIKSDIDAGLASTLAFHS